MYDDAMKCTTYDTPNGEFGGLNVNTINNLNLSNGKFQKEADTSIIARTNNCRLITNNN